MSGPLEGIRILDLTRLLPGGFATLILADLGAEVLKIEEPGKGDYIRWTPPFDGEMSAGHLALNRNKRSMTLNLKSEQGPAILKRLARDADVLIESYRPGVMDRLGVGYSVLSETNERLVWCAITGYGQDGPYKNRAGHDVNYLGYSGVLSIIGPREGPPVIPGVQIGDVGGGGLMGAVGILAALQERARTGRGRFVDISMTDGAASWLAFHGQAFLFDGVIPRPSEMRLNGSVACYQLYGCKDGKYLTVGALEPQFWEALCNALGVPEFIPQHFAPQDVQDQMIAKLSEIFSSKTRDEWVAALGEKDMCVGPVNDLSEALADPQLRSRGMVAKVEGRETIGNPVRLTGDSTTYRDAPGFGEHTDDVLASAGYSKQEIVELRDAGAI